MYAPCAGDPSFSLVMPPGWRVEALANLTQACRPAACCRHAARKTSTHAATLPGLRCQSCGLQTRTLPQSSPQAEGPAIPLLLVLVNEEANQVVFLVRPTLGAYEWQLDFM